MAKNPLRNVAAQELLSKLGSMQLRGISEAIARWERGEDDVVTVDAHLPNLISVSEHNLPPFDCGYQLRSYRMTIVPDALNQLAPQLRWPIVFWVSPENGPGVRLTRLEAPKARIVSLGKPHSFVETYAVLCHLLAEQGIPFQPWTITLEEYDVDPEDPVFLPRPPEGTADPLLPQ